MTNLNETKKFKFPSSTVMLFIIICAVTISTYIVPAGSFENIINPVTGKEMVDPDSFAFLDRTPVSIFQMFVSIKAGFIDGAQIIFLIVFGFFWVYSIMQTGALTALINKLLGGKTKDSNFSFQS